MRGAIPRTYNSQSPPGGLTLAEVLVALMIFSIIVSALYEVTSVALASWKARSEGDMLSSEGQWALEEMLRHVRGSNHVLIPLNEFPVSRDVLALGEMILDTNQDGFLDADNDKDGRINEDWSDDMTADAVSGIIGIDDDGDGLVDEISDVKDDDEDGLSDADKWDGVDNDLDGRVDEDTKADRQDDSKPGITGIDDDGDALIDEGANEDDDEDGVSDEDPIEPVVFYLDTATNRLIERLPNYGTASFSDFIEAPIVSNVKTFTVNRLTKKSGVLVSLTLALESPGGNTVTLQTQVLARKYP